MKRHATIRWTGLCALVGMAWSGLTWAQSPPADVAGTTEVPIQAWHAVSDQRLDGVRGGFDDGSGLLASFGLDRLVYINGNLVSSSNVKIPDIAHITGQQAEALAAATGTVNVIQVGPGNTVDPAVLQQAAGTGATVIQNSLDNQNIQSLTRLDITLSGLGVFKNLDLQGTLQSALLSRMGQ